MSGFVVKLEPGGNLNRIIRNMLERVKRLDGADQVLGFMGILLDDPDEAVSRCNVTAINSFIALDDLRGEFAVKSVTKSKGGAHHLSRFFSELAQGEFHFGWEVTGQFGCSPGKFDGVIADFFNLRDNGKE